MSSKHSKVYEKTSYRAQRKNRRVEKNLVAHNFICRFLGFSRLGIPQWAWNTKYYTNDILQTIRHFWTRKAPGSFQIPNVVLKVIANENLSLFKTDLQSFAHISHYPPNFKESTIVIIRQHGDNCDYTSPKSYWPISLLNKIGKIMQAILATKLATWPRPTVFYLKLTVEAGGDRALK